MTARPTGARLARGLAPIARGLALLPALVFVIASFSADMVAATGRDPIGIWQVLPAGPVSGSWINAEVSSTALLLLAISLGRAKRAGWALSLAVLGAAIVVQGAVHHHPIAVAVAIVLGAILVATRHRYVVRTGDSDLARATVLLGFGALLVVVDAISTRGGILHHGEGIVGTWLDLGSVGRLSLGSNLAVLLVIARVAFIGATALILDPAPDPRPEPVRRAARSALSRLGRGALLPYQHGPLAEPFASPDGEGALAYARAGRTAVALGDPSGPAASSAFHEWLDQCRIVDWQPAVYQASDGFAEVLLERGWHAIRIGSEAIVRPTTFDLSTPRLANVRHTVTRARRGGLRTTSSRQGSVLPLGTSIPDLEELDASWRRGNGPALGFTVGRLEPSTLPGALVVAALGGNDRLEAFVVLRPTGTDGGWMLDLMRRRPGGVPGAVELCLVGAIEALRDRGVERLSLGLAPLAGLSIHAGPPAERLVAIAARSLRPVYDVEGLAFYKDKFGPTWEPRHLVVPHASGFPGAALALVWLHLGGSLTDVLRSILGPLARLADRTAVPISPSSRPTAH